MNVRNTFSKKKQIDFKVEPVMFLDFASRMKSFYHTLEQYCIRQRELSHPWFQF